MCVTLFLDKTFAIEGLRAQWEIRVSPLLMGMHFFNFHNAEGLQVCSVVFAFLFFIQKCYTYYVPALI